MPMYNVEKWVGLALNTLKLQTFRDFHCVIVEDCSEDRTKEVVKFNIKDDNRFTLIENKKRNGTQLGNGLKALDFYKPEGEEIVIFHDGDDWLSSTQVLSYLDKVYDSYDCWMTYGNWVKYPDFSTGEHMLIDIPEHVDNELDGYRKFPFIFTHLRTSKAFLWKNLNRKDLIDPITKEYFSSAADVAVQLPFVEMCRKEKAMKITQPLLTLNRTNSESVANHRLTAQKNNENYIRTLKPYSKYVHKK